MKLERAERRDLESVVFPEHDGPDIAIIKVDDSREESLGLLLCDILKLSTPT